jgi:hypothetical protein
VNIVAGDQQNIQTGDNSPVQAAQGTRIRQKFASGSGQASAGLWAKLLVACCVVAALATLAATATGWVDTGIGVGLTLALLAAAGVVAGVAR